MRNGYWVSRYLCGVLLAALAVVAHADEGDRNDSSGNDFSIRTLSNRADLISDGDALVEVSVPSSVALPKVRDR